MADDAALQLFRSNVNCAAVLEGMVGGLRLDVRESTRRALKYRRGKGEVLIVTFGCASLDAAEPHLSAEHRALGLFTLEEIAALPMPEGYRRSIRNWALPAR